MSEQTSLGWANIVEFCSVKLSSVRGIVWTLGDGAFLIGFIILKFRILCVQHDKA